MDWFPMPLYLSRRFPECVRRGCAGVLLGTAALTAAASPSLPAYDTVRAQYASSSAMLLDRHGRELEQVRTDFLVRKGDWVALQDVSPALVRAVIMSEDRGFYQHNGVDWGAMAAAAWAQVASDHARGASTITMQLAGLLSADLALGPKGRTVVQKVDQVLQARELESVWSKSQILEAYLNLASFRGELVGIEAVSRVSFGKRPIGLNLQESAVIAALLRGPNASARLLERRACDVLQQLGSPQLCLTVNQQVRRAVQRTRAPWADRVHSAPHVAGLLRFLGYPLGAGPVYTSLDADLQHLARQSLNDQLAMLSRATVHDGAIVVLDNATGEILAYVGSSGDYSQAPQVDHARSLRQAGSTLKPFLYAQAIEQKRITAASLLEDQPLSIAAGGALYQPQNYDERFSGWVSARTALASSLNIPAVRVLMQVTPIMFARRLRDLGLPLSQEGDFYGYSLALGSADVTLLSLTNAYRALANLGQFRPVTLIPNGGVSESRQVIDAAAAWIVGDILSDRLARSRAFGLDSPLSTPFWTAVKTGTSKDMRDNWCMGWSARYTVGVWVGNSLGASMHNVSGVSGACPVWHDLMRYLHATSGAEAQGRPAPPASVQAQLIEYEPALEPARHEYFVGDTVQQRIVLAVPASLKSTVQAIRPRIVSPVHGTVIALDPDIPVTRQKLWLKADGLDASQLSWRVNGHRMGGGPQRWAPVPGRHRVELLDRSDQVVDQVWLEVRG